jgi:NADH dehydrogenase
MGEVVDVDAVASEVTLADGIRMTYDHLILAAGASHSYFGHDEWAAFGPGLKTLEDAFEIRRRILFAFEAAEKEEDPATRADLLNFVVVGAGPTGVEMAGTLPGEFRNFDPASARVLLLEGGPRVLQAMPQALSERARQQLVKLGVAASRLGRALQRSSQCELDRAGRVVVQADLTEPGYERISVIGDLAAAISQRTGQPLAAMRPW